MPENKENYARELSNSLAAKTEVDQIGENQKLFRRITVGFVLFSFIVIVSYVYIPGIESISFSQIFGFLNIGGDTRPMRILMAIILLYYVILFGTSYYKGVIQIAQAKKRIDDSGHLDNGAKEHYKSCLHDFYLFDAMMKIIDSTIAKKEHPKKERPKKERPKKERPKKETDDTKVVDDGIRIAVAWFTVVTFASLVIIDEFFVIMAVTDFTGRYNILYNIVLVVGTGSFVFLSYLFYSMVGEQMKTDRDKVKILTRTLCIIQIIIFISLPLTEAVGGKVERGCKIFQSDEKCLPSNDNGGSPDASSEE